MPVRSPRPTFAKVIQNGQLSTQDNRKFSQNKPKQKKKTTLLSLALFASLHMAAAQTLEKMTWFNEPEQWEISGNTLSLFVTPQSDYWRISHD